MQGVPNSLGLALGHFRAGGLLTWGVRIREGSDWEYGLWTG